MNREEVRRSDNLGLKILALVLAVAGIVRRHPEVVEFAIEVYRQREMHELHLKVEIAGPTNGVIERLTTAFSNDLRIRASIEHVQDGSLPRFELKSRRLRIVE